MATSSHLCTFYASWPKFLSNALILLCLVYKIFSDKTQFKLPFVQNVQSWSIIRKQNKKYAHLCMMFHKPKFEEVFILALIRHTGDDITVRYAVPFDILPKESIGSSPIQLALTNNLKDLLISNGQVTEEVEICFRHLGGCWLQRYDVWLILLAVGFVLWQHFHQRQASYNRS